MKKSLYIYLFGFLICFFSTQVSAKGGKCGLAARTFGDTLFAQVLAISYNATSSLSNTVSVTSKTSGCTNSGFVQYDRANMYLLTSYENVEEDITKGNGVYLDNFVNTIECNASAYGQIRLLLVESIATTENISSHGNITAEEKRHLSIKSTLDLFYEKLLHSEIINLCKIPS